MGTSLFGALGQLGEQFGQAKSELTAENLQAQQIAAQLQRQKALDQIAQQRLGFEQQRLGFEQQRLTGEEKARADNLELQKQKGWEKPLIFKSGDRRFQMNPITGETKDAMPGQLTFEEEEALKHKPAGVKEFTDAQGNVWDLSSGTAKPITGPGGKQLKGHIPKGSGGTGAGTGEGSPLIKAMANKWANEGVKPPAKYLPTVEAYMEANDMKSRTPVNAAEKKMGELVYQVQPKVDTAIKLIEDNGLQNENNWVMGNYSVLAQHMRFWQYQRGHAPNDKLAGDLLKSAAALQVMGAAPWMQMGRGKYLFDTIVQHLPSPTDTPQNLYQKLLFLKGIMDDAQSALPEGAMPQPQSIDSAIKGLKY